MLFADDLNTDSMNHLRDFCDHLGKTYCKEAKNFVSYKQNVQSSFLFEEKIVQNW